MRFSTRIVIVVLTMVVMVGAGCGSATKSMRAGAYDKAIRKVVKKLRRNNDHTKSIKILEEAFAKANQRDLDRINYLKQEGRPDIWPEVFDRYSQVSKRQNLIQPLLPLGSANFSFINYDREMINAKKKAAEFLYTNALELLKQNDRGAARQAHAELIKVRTYYANYRDINHQINRALDLGTNKVLVKMVNATGVPLPPDFERDLTKMSVHELNSKWISYHNEAQKGQFYDYEIVMNMQIIDVGPEAVKEVEYKEEKKVEDGWEYILDENGNVLKDTAGNDLKRIKHKIITCYVIETQQTKVARISGSVDYKDTRANQMIRSFPITADGVFEHFAARANGDLNALSEETRLKINNRPVPFPPDFDLLMLAGRTLQPMIKDIVWDNKGLVKY